MSNHAPGCEDYKTEPFARIEFAGAAMIVEEKDVAEIFELGCGYEVTTVMLTRDQFERMEESHGF